MFLISATQEIKVRKILFQGKTPISPNKLGVDEHTCGLTMQEARGRRILDQASLRKYVRPCLKITKARRARGWLQW
jgi:hypothetical protein